MTSRQATGTTRCGSSSPSSPTPNRGATLARTGPCSRRDLPVRPPGHPTTSTPRFRASWCPKRERLRAVGPRVVLAPARRRTGAVARACVRGVRLPVLRAGRDRSPRRAPDRGRRAAVGRRPALRASGELVAELQSLVHQHPLREHLDRAAHAGVVPSPFARHALRAYGRRRRQLAEELRLDPSAALQRLEQQIICGDPVLDALAAPPSHPARSAGARL